MFQCAHSLNRRINTRPQLSAFGRSEKTCEITRPCCTTWNVEQNPRCFFNDVFFITISLDSAGSVRSQIPSVWCQFSPSVRRVPIYFRLNTTYTKVTESCLILQLYTSSAEVKRRFRKLWCFMFTYFVQKIQGLFSSVAMNSTVHISFLYQIIKQNIRIPWTSLCIIRSGFLKGQRL